VHSANPPKLLQKETLMRKVNQENVAGVWSAMPTPFTEKLELDTESVSRLVEHHVRLGIKG
jgi:hypothetical protein